MDLKEFGKALAKIGLPLLGAALPIPGGMAIGTALAAVIDSPTAKPEDILATISGNAEALFKARQFEQTHQQVILKITAEYEIAQRQADSADVAVVNATMQAESKSEHWAQWLWRPYNGFMFGTTMFGCYFVLPLAKITPPSIPFEAWTAWGAILGVTAWFRGKQQLSATQ